MSERSPFDTVHDLPAKKGRNIRDVHMLSADISKALANLSAGEVMEWVVDTPQQVHAIRSMIRYYALVKQCWGANAFETTTSRRSGKIVLTLKRHPKI